MPDQLPLDDSTPDEPLEGFVSDVNHLLAKSATAASVGDDDDSIFSVKRLLLVILLSLLVLLTPGMFGSILGTVQDLVTRRNNITKTTLLTECTSKQVQSLEGGFSWVIGHEPSTATVRIGTAIGDDAFRVDIMSTGAEGPLELIPQLGSCNLRAMTVPKITECLSGRHVMFVGDSTMRYQYLAITSALPANAYVMWNPSTENDDNFGGWTNFFQASTDRQSGFGVCDCFRPGNAPEKQTIQVPVDEAGLGGFQAGRRWGNRYYREKARNLELTFVEALGEFPVVPWNEPRSFGVDCEKSQLGVEFPPQQHCGIQSAFCEPGKCSEATHHVDVWTRALRSLILRTRPAVILLNSGLWGVQWANRVGSNDQGSPSNVDELISTLEWAMSPVAGGAGSGDGGVIDGGGVTQVIWRSTTAQDDQKLSRHGGFDQKKLKTQREELVIEAFIKRGWPVLDFSKITGMLRDKAAANETDSEVFRELTFQADSAVHYTQSMYRALNEVVFSTICNQ